MIMARKKKPEFLSKTLKRVRQEAGMTQVRLAEAAGISLETLQQLEQGLRLPSYTVLQKLSRALNISAGVLVDEPAPPPRKKGK
jgi:transcriptional regulator with XRE-family HTH domain